MTWLGCAAVFLFGIELGVCSHRGDARAVATLFALIAFTLHIDPSGSAKACRGMTPKTCRGMAPEALSRASLPKKSAKPRRRSSRRPAKASPLREGGVEKAATQGAEREQEGQWTVVLRRKPWYSDC